MTTDAAGGIWTFTLELVRSLSARGWDVWLATLGSVPSALQQRDAESIRGVRLFPSAYKLEWMADPWEDIAAASRWLLDLERRCAPDAIHLNSYCHATLPWNAPVVLTAHWCVTSWWQAARMEEAPASWDRYRAYVKEALLAADIVTAPSRAMADTLTQNYDVARGRIQVVPHGLSGEDLPPRSKAGLMFTVGQPWDEGKNVRELACIAKDLPWPVCVAGPERDSAGTRFAFPDCVMLGPLPPRELAEWYARAAVFVLPARYAPFGYSVLEAAHSGCVLVLGDIPSLRELWQGAAIFVPSDDTAVLRYTLRELTGQPRWRELMALRARTRAQMFTPRRMAEHYIALYDRVREERTVCAS